MPDLMNGEDVAGATATGNTTGRYTPYQYAWFYVVGGMAMLWFMGYFVFRGRSK
jgi:hypothetical protein